MLYLCQVLSKIIKARQNIIKPRLSAWGFEEPNDLLIDSPCCSQIGRRSIFELEASDGNLKLST